MKPDRTAEGGGASPGGNTPRVSPLLLSLFSRYAQGYLARHFHTVRLSRAGFPDRTLVRGRPVVVYLNHPSWWDPLIGMLLALSLFPDRRHFSPIDAAALGKYKFFERLGFFGIEPGTARGARRFLTVAQEILGGPQSGDACLWITAGGRFADPRERPVRLQAGLGHLASRLRDVVLLPLALEYPFWEERFPEALARFGEPVSIGDADLSPEEWTALLEEKLAAAQDTLAAEALTRDPVAFEILLGGSAGVGGVYDTWRRLRSYLRGERFRPEHGARGTEHNRSPS
jgi:1-acyl-sn-glycerol-3-phosphate acyltransferase